MKKKHPSFSKPINQLVIGAFGIALLLISMASAVLLYLSEESLEQYYIRIAELLAVYLLLFIISVIYISRKIRKMFLPLDRLAVGLARDEVLVDRDNRDLRALATSLKKQAQRMDALSKELHDTKENLDDVSKASREDRDELCLMLERCIMDVERLRQRRDDMENQSLKLEECIARALPLENEIRAKRDGLNGLTAELDAAVRDYLTTWQDTENGFGELNNVYTVLGQMHTESGEMIESIYTELSAVQSVASQINLYAMNTSLDIARSGVTSLTAISALDEIKNLSARMNERLDEVQLMVIRARNALHLSIDQTTECKEKGEECATDLENSGKRLEELSGKLKELMETNDEMSGSVGRLTGTIYELKMIEEKRQREAEKLGENTGRLHRTIREWKTQQEKEEHLNTAVDGMVLEAICKDTAGSRKEESE